MICPESEGMSEEESFPMLHGFEAGQGFSLGNRIVSLCGIQCLVEEGDGDFGSIRGEFLAQHCSYSDVRSVCGQEGCGFGVEELKLGLLSDHGLQGPESFVFSFTPLKRRVLPGESSEGFSNAACILKEVLKVVHSSQELLYFLDTGRGFCFCNGFYIVGIRGDSILGDDVTERWNGVLGDPTLRRLQSE